MKKVMIKIVGKSPLDEDEPSTISSKPLGPHNLVRMVKESYEYSKIYKSNHHAGGAWIEIDGKLFRPMFHFDDALAGEKTEYKCAQEFIKYFGSGKWEGD